MKSFFLHVALTIALALTATVAVGQSLKTDPQPKIEVNIYPNPVQDVFQLTNSDAVKFISIYNIPGKEIKRFEVRGNNTFSITDLSKGIYIIRLFDHSNEPLKVMRLNKA